MVGGLTGGARSAEYGDVTYSGNQIRAKGAPSSTLRPGRRALLSHVNYETGFAIGISTHFKVGVRNFSASKPTCDHHSTSRMS